jgi:hypothetical protein
MARIRVEESGGEGPSGNPGFLKFLTETNTDRGKAFFDELGDRLPGTGEHVVHVEPKKGGATIRVVSIGSSGKSSRRQRLIKVEREIP